MSYSYLYVFTLTLRLTPHAKAKSFSGLIIQGNFLLNENAVKLFGKLPWFVSKLPEKNVLNVGIQCR